MPDNVDNISHLLGQIASKRPDIVEFRLDKLHDLTSVEVLGRKKTLPAIATDKANRDQAARKKLLLTAASSGFEYVDVEVSSINAKGIMKECKGAGAEVIASSHDFTRTPSQVELNETFNSLRQIGADICKIVTTATQHRDNLEVLNFVRDRSNEARLVSFAMGSLGVSSRILSPIFGAEFTFAALNHNSPTADGQLGIDDLREAWRLLGIQ